MLVVIIVWLKLSRILSCRLTEKLSSWSGLPHRAGRRHDRDGEPALGTERAAKRAERQHQEAVLRATEGVALAHQRAHHRAQARPDLEALPHRIRDLEQRILQIGADHAGVRAEIVIELADEAPPPQLPAAGLEKRLGGAAHVHAPELLVAAHHHRFGVGHGRDRHRQLGVGDERAVVELAHHRPVAQLPPVAAVHAPGPLVHEQRVRAERVELTGEARLHTGLDHEDDDHRRDANRHAGNGEGSAQLVRPQRAQRLHHGVA
jgi:hypothetical protein